jgi:uncharacterized protein YcfJ
MLNPGRLASITLLLLLSSCATVPEGPSVRALPGTGKAPQQFNADDAYCRQIALQQSGGSSANQNAVDSEVRSAALGTLLGAAAGALIGGGHEGAGVGAGTGLVFGALAGTEAAGRSAYTTQQRYDVAYAQCMYDLGHRVPVSGSLVVQRSHATPPPPPPMTATPTALVSEQLFVYPKGGQTDARIAEDRRKCAAWASTQTGFDPAKDNPADPRHGDFKRATAACLESHGYSVK